MTLYPTLLAIKQDVDQRIVYDNSNTLSQLPDFTWVTAGSNGRGDCSCFAQTYYEECKLRGMDVVKHTYELKPKLWHAVAIVSDGDIDWIMDVRNKEPVKA